MKLNRTVLSVGALSFFVALMLGSASVPKEPPVAENFIYTPPATSSPTKSKIDIAILKPSTTGSFFVAETPMATAGKLSIDRMATAMQSDIEKIVIARGYTTAGAFASIDEMTYSQKERASFILRPIINLDLLVEGKQGTISGNVTLEMLEPLSKEKIWIKRLNLDQFTGPIEYEVVTQNGPQGLQLVNIISANSVKRLLNTFYKPALAKIWDHFDPIEITGLKLDSEKLKGRTNYQGK
jgi:hypothetical protein